MSEEIRLLPCPYCGVVGLHRCGETRVLTPEEVEGILRDPFSRPDAINLARTCQSAWSERALWWAEAKLAAEDAVMGRRWAGLWKRAAKGQRDGRLALRSACDSYEAQVAHLTAERDAALARLDQG